MKTRYKTVIPITASIVALIIILPNFYIDEMDSTTMFCERWLFSDHRSCKPLDSDLVNIPTICGKDFVKRGDYCYPDPNTIPANTIVIHPIHSLNNVRNTPIPHTSVIHLEKNSTVTWINESDFTATIYDEKEKWAIDSIKPKMRKQMQFNQTGFYEYATDAGNRGSGVIAVISNETASLPYFTKLEIARAIIEQDTDNYHLVYLGIGNAENSLSIGIDKKYIEKNRDAHSFFMKRYTEMIPFDVKITLEFVNPIRTQ